MISSEKVIIRPLNQSDLERIVALHNNVEIKKLTMMHPFPVSLEMDKNWFDRVILDTSNKEIYFAIEEKVTNTFSGFSFLTRINWINRNCYFGIVLDPEYQNKGIGKETTKLLINYGFNHLNLNKILLEVIVNNKPAIELYRKIGFVEEGLLKQQYFSDNNYQDVLLMSIFKNVF